MLTYIHIYVGGTPIFDSDAREDATLIHVLVHLREGRYPGEYGTGVCTF